MQQPLVSGVVVSAAVKAGGAICNKVFDYNITLIASFVTVVDNRSGYTSYWAYLFSNLVHFVVVK